MENTWNITKPFNDNNDERDKFMIQYNNDFCKAAREGNMAHIEELLKIMDNVMQLEFYKNVSWTMPIPEGVFENGQVDIINKLL